MKKNTINNNNNCSSSYVHPACVPTTTKKEGCCTECVHPIEYIFDLVLFGLNNNATTKEFIDNFVRILDKGYVTQNCNVCCATCDNLYFLGGVQPATLVLYEALNYTQQADVPPGSSYTFGNNDGNICCSNVTSSVGEYLKYAEAIGYTGANLDGSYDVKVKACCNDFTNCSKELIKWVSNGKSRYLIGGYGLTAGMLDFGIVEHGEIINNCTNKKVSGVCVLLEKIKNQQIKDPDFFSKASDRHFFYKTAFEDLGFVSYCNELGDVSFGSVGTWLEYAEAMGYRPPDIIA